MQLPAKKTHHPSLPVSAPLFPTLPVFFNTYAGSPNLSGFFKPVRLF